jgi:predicted transcriptional regulator
MARTTISIPDDLKAEMDTLGEQVNWSATAADAFRAEIQRVKIQKAKTEGKKMNAAIERLKQSKEQYVKDAGDRGRSDGTVWAMNKAEYGQLKGLAAAWPEIETTDTDDPMGPACVLVSIINPDDYNSTAVNAFWNDLGKERNDVDWNSSDYWDGFIEAAVEFFESAELD